MPSTVESPVADLPQSFEAWWSVPGNWVEEPNRRRGGWSGMMRLSHGGRLYYVKKQCNLLHRSLERPLGEPTTAREHRNIERLTRLGIRVPKVVFHGLRRTSEGLEGLLVTESLDGFVSLDAAPPLDRPALKALAQAVGSVVGTLHRAYLQHSCLYDKHVMVRWDDGRPEIALIDLEKLRRPWLPWRAAAHDLDQLSRHQSIWSSADWQELLAAHRTAMRR
jgi:tRNA A-37 threonylcarbamoyl transferase component Bud32